MRMIEPHIHTVSRTTDDYYRMALSGIVACVEPSFWSGTDRRAVASFEDYWEHMITHETARAAQYDIRHYVMIGLNPKEAGNPIAPSVVNAMEPFLDQPSVVGIGEIGLDRITPEEEEIFRIQLRMGDRRRMPITIHSPHHNKKKGIERIIEIIEEEGVVQERIVIDHNTEETIGLSLSTRCWAGMTVYYVTKLSAERAVNMLVRYGTDRMIVNGSADWGYSDPLAVPKVALEMRKRGLFSEEAIRKVVFANPHTFLSHSPFFDGESDGER
ncbi:MAG: TatD family hydrolase [Alphaproteobacteria bacterium]|uniref:TatD family hydrolase n=1 Tax=Candidatus Nitrobium versatile TaxID=2884831 RepID=A0A953M348_9BACT|nr:TatD family hydrolase [Candidatus Nitrobium versatile]